MKKFKLLIIIVLMLSLTGCMQKYELSGQQSNETAEYMAGLILKYDRGYKDSLTPMEDLDTGGTDNNAESGGDDTPTPTSKPADTSPNGVSTSEESSKDYTLSEVIGEKSIDVEYTGYKLCDTYPEDTTNTYFRLDPREGNQLLVASFTLKNISDKKLDISLSDADVLYQLDINVGTVYKPLLTLLENDLQYANITLDAGKSKTVLLVFEVSKKIDISEINLIASKDNKTDIIEIK